MAPRTVIVLTAVGIVAAVAGAYALTRSHDVTPSARRASPGPSPIVTEGPSPRAPGSGVAGVASPGSAGAVAGASAGPPSAPIKIAASKATPAQVEEAFVAMSAARLCAVQTQAFQNRGDLEQRAATASTVALSAQQTKAMATRLATDPALAKRVSARFRATCKLPTR
ncbi:MAG: hypothetical protein QOJ50_4096 [Cryptosporangiaceae bacterium]|nr:hypothetical protein [Cryptosporangiaceae bacterium]